MENKHYYKIAVRRKILYVTDVFSSIAFISILIFLLFNFILFPFKNVDSWTQSIFFNQLYPKTFSIVYIGSILISFISIFLSIILRIYKPAIIFFDTDNICFRSLGFTQKYYVSHLKYVVINNATALNGTSKEQLTVMFETKKQKSIKFKLKNYLEADAFTNCFLNYSTLEVRLYEFPFGPY